MATVVDAARDAEFEEGDYNTVYQKGNGDTPTWLSSYKVLASVQETAGSAPADAGAPIIELQFLDKTENTFRPVVE